jgi:hypothetical protein
MAVVPAGSWRRDIGPAALGDCVANLDDIGDYPAVTASIPVLSNPPLEAMGVNVRHERRHKSGETVFGTSARRRGQAGTRAVTAISTNAPSGKRETSTQTLAG